MQFSRYTIDSFRNQWRIRESNSWPLACHASALANWANPPSGDKYRHIFKICKKYLTHIQNSVFEGEISTVQLEKLRGELKPHVNTNLDSVILFKSRSEKWLDKEFWGKEDDLTSFIIWLSTRNSVKYAQSRQWRYCYASSIFRA